MVRPSGTTVEQLGVVLGACLADCLLMGAQYRDGVGLLAKVPEGQHAVLGAGAQDVMLGRVLGEAGDANLESCISKKTLDYVEKKTEQLFCVLCSAFMQRQQLTCLLDKVKMLAQSSSFDLRSHSFSWPLMLADAT